jgi:hypothetical protein
LIDICSCVPTGDPNEDHRSAAKHVPLPNTEAQDTTVKEILGWPVDPALLPTSASRQGRELQVFHLKQAFLQRVKLVHTDCDVHFEISETPEKNAPRIIVETPVDSEYCPAREAIQRQLVDIGISLAGSSGVELSTPATIDVLGMAFEDFNHPNRGTSLVATIWELHPAIVRITE